MPFAPRPAASLENVSVEVSGHVAGEILDVSVDGVEFAFTQGDADPTTFYTGAWETNNTTTPPTYTALCLAGPGGTVELTAGNWVVWVKITDVPEIPIQKVSGILTIT